MSSKRRIQRAILRRKKKGTKAIPDKNGQRSGVKYYEAFQRTNLGRSRSTRNGKHAHDNRQHPTSSNIIRNRGCHLVNSSQKGLMDFKKISAGLAMFAIISVLILGSLWERNHQCRGLHLETYCNEHEAIFLWDRGGWSDMPYWFGGSAVCSTDIHGHYWHVNASIFKETQQSC